MIRNALTVLSGTWKRADTLFSARIGLKLWICKRRHEAVRELETTRMVVTSAQTLQRYLECRQLEAREKMLSAENEYQMFGTHT